MGLFGKKKETGTEKVYSLLKADMHSHLLPGIDDGSPDMKTSLELIRGMKALGYSKLITTPHIMGDMYRNSRELIEAKLAELKSAAENEGIEIALHAAAEYFLDDYVASMLK